MATNQEAIDASAQAPTQTANPARMAVIALLGAALIWSTSFVTTKIALTDTPPLTLGALRFALAAGVLGGVGIVTRRIESVSRINIAILSVGGLLGITAYFALQNLGVQLTSAADASLLVASYPAVTMLVESLLLRKRASLMRFAGVGMTMIGVYLVVQQTSNAPGGSGRLVGDMLLLLTGLVWALYNFATRNVVHRYSMLTVIFWQTLVGAVAFIPLAIIERHAWQSLSTGSVLSIVYMSLFCSILAFLFYARGLRHVDPGSAVGLMNLVPVFGLILAAAGLGEQVTLAQIVGGLIVVGGVLLSVRV